MKNWKTTLAGVLTAALGIAHFAFPNVFTSELCGAIGTLLVATGLIAAKDGNVNDGTLTQ